MKRKEDNMDSHQNCTHTIKKDKSGLRIAISATTHCLIGCSIGEFLGLFIGVTFGLSVFYIIILGVSLAFISGFLLTLIPILKSKKMSLWSAFKIIWVGETISIGVMEVVMNYVDYNMGGMSVSSVLDPTFWTGFLVSLPLGFIAALPVNYIMISRGLKEKCH